MRIPAVKLQFQAFPVAIPRDVDESDAGLDQPSGDERALPEQGAGVAIANLRIDLVEIEGVAHFRRREDAPGPIFLSIEASQTPLLLDAKPLRVQLSYPLLAADEH